MVPCKTSPGVLLVLKKAIKSFSPARIPFAVLRSETIPSNIPRGMLNAENIHSLLSVGRQSTRKYGWKFDDQTITSELNTVVGVGLMINVELHLA